VPQILGEVTPQILNMNFQIWFATQYAAQFGCVLFGEFRGYLTKNKIEERREITDN